MCQCLHQGTHITFCRSFCGFSPSTLNVTSFCLCTISSVQSQLLCSAHTDFPVSASAFTSSDEKDRRLRMPPGISVGTVGVQRHKRQINEQRIASSLSDSVLVAPHIFCLGLHCMWRQQPDALSMIFLLRSAVCCHLLPGDSRAVDAKINQTVGRL